jgi:hypothetical protein
VTEEKELHESLESLVDLDNPLKWPAISAAKLGHVRERESSLRLQLLTDLLVVGTKIKGDLPGGSDQSESPPQDMLPRASTSAPGPLRIGPLITLQTME